jgi:hypothetical protein
MAKKKKEDVAAEITLAIWGAMFYGLTRKEINHAIREGFSPQAVRYYRHGPPKRNPRRRSVRRRSRR